MARTTEEINVIIAELKTHRNTRDASIESAAAALDGTDDKNAKRLRSLRHVKEIANDTYVCTSCRLMRNDDDDVIAMAHEEHEIEDRIVTDADGNSVTEKGLKTLLVDESYTVTGSTTVENL